MKKVKTGDKIIKKMWNSKDILISVEWLAPSKDGIWLNIAGTDGEGHKDIWTMRLSDVEVLEEQVSDEDRSCETCIYEELSENIEPCLHCVLGIGLRNVNYNWQPKEAKEKPKKLKYVCTACVGTKCIKKTIGVLPTNCKYPQANWKLKEVK